jgi:hypothetical protein
MVLGSKTRAALRSSRLHPLPNFILASAVGSYWPSGFERHPTPRGLLRSRRWSQGHFSCARESSSYLRLNIFKPYLSFGCISEYILRYPSFTSTDRLQNIQFDRGQISQTPPCIPRRSFSMGVLMAAFLLPFAELRWTAAYDLEFLSWLHSSHPPPLSAHFPFAYLTAGSRSSDPDRNLFSERFPASRDQL